MVGKVEIIDIHSHIVPGVDDGAQDLDESIELIKPVLILLRISMLSQ